jgi:hypothetical protein
MPPSYPPTPYPVTPAANSLRAGTSHPDLRVRAHMNALSASFSAMADQLQAASKTFLTSAPSSAAAPGALGLDPNAVLSALNELSARIDKIERTQNALNMDFDDLRSQMDRLSITSDSRAESSAASEIHEEATPKVFEKKSLDEDSMDAVMSRVTEQLESRIGELMENFKLESVGLLISLRRFQD